jgi:hypothetical protein
LTHTQTALHWTSSGCLWLLVVVAAAGLGLHQAAAASAGAGAAAAVAAAAAAAAAGLTLLLSCQVLSECVPQGSLPLQQSWALARQPWQLLLLG